MHSVPQEGKGRKGATDVGKGWGAGIVTGDLVRTLSTGKEGGWEGGREGEEEREGGKEGGREGGGEGG